MSGFIAYDKKNGIEYAKVCFSYREDKKVKKTYLNLGRVIDKENLIFKNRKNGIFKYNLNDGTFSEPDSSTILDAMQIKEKKEKLILDFGDVYFLHEFICDDGLMPALQAIECSNNDTLLSMLSYYILCKTANCHAQDWWEISYARILYPNANLASQRISDFLTEIGEEHRIRKFFGEYIKYTFSKSSGSSNILIDSTGLPNNIHFPLTAVSNHNGKVSNEVRLIYVMEQETGLPIFFRYVPGNIVDVSTLIRTIKELKETGVTARFTVLDAGYYAEDNIMYLFQENISFLTRLKGNLKLHKQLVDKYLPALFSEDNLVEYNDRYLYIKRVNTELAEDCYGYAYICTDLDQIGVGLQQLSHTAKANKLKKSDIHRKIKSQGVFILVSSQEISIDDVIPLYYARQQIEQIFDIGKNQASLLPLRIQKEDTFRGHLLLTFIASVVLKRIQQKLLKTCYNTTSLFINLHGQKCKVFDDHIITQEPNKKANDCYKLFDITCPIEIKV